MFQSYHSNCDHYHKDIFGSLPLLIHKRERKKVAMVAAWGRQRVKRMEIASEKDRHCLQRL